jgi:ubiquinone/menaquinone biosynthesis C-methylase UbiE
MNDDTLETVRSWQDSAAAYIAFQDAGDGNRTLLLDPVMLALCGGVRGQRVLDLGSGEGRFCRMLADRGATVTGIDPIAEMIRASRERGGSGDAYALAAAEALPFADAAFDLVVSYVTLVDIVDYATAIRDAARALRPGGRFVVANLNFVTASQGWQRDADGNRLYHRVDRYADEWPQTYEWAGMRIVNWHRPLANYMHAFLSSGLLLRDFLEPVPEDQSLRDDPQFEDWFRVPIFTVMRWEKPAA